MKELAKSVVARRLGLAESGEPEAQTALTRLAKIGEQEEDDFLQNAQQGLRFKQVKALKARYTGEVCALRGNDPKVQALKTQIVALENRYGIADDDFEKNALKLATQVVAKSTLEEALAGREDFEHAAILRDTGERFTRILGDSSFEKSYFQPQIQARLGKASDALLEEIEAGRRRSERAVAAKREVEALYSLAPGLRSNGSAVGSRDWQRNLAWRSAAHEAAARLAQNRGERSEEGAKIGDLQSQLDALSSQTEQDASEREAETARAKTQQSLEAARQSRLRSGDPIISVKAPRDSRQVVANLPDGTALALAWNNASENFQTRFPAPALSQGGTYTIAVSVVAANGNRQEFSMFFAVNTQKPGVVGEVGETWNPKFKGDARTNQVSVLAPWGRVELLGQDGVFGSQLGVPKSWQGRKVKVRYVVTDKARSTIEIEVDWR